MIRVSYIKTMQKMNKLKFRIKIGENMIFVFETYIVNIKSKAWLNTIISKSNGNVNLE